MEGKSVGLLEEDWSGGEGFRVRGGGGCEPWEFCGPS
jgi:hypothetical protein